MRHYRVFLLVTIWLVGAGVLNHARAQTPTTIRYEPLTVNIANPERGFYDQDAVLWFNDERNPMTVDYLRGLRRQKITLVRWYFLIDEFRQSPIDADTLTFIDSQFDAAREAGVKVIPRFAYNFPTSGEYPYSEPDAPLKRVLAHIDQLAPILQENADVIALMELGFVGAWGEWHSSTNHLVDDETGINDASRQIVARLMAALPQSRTLAMRYMPYKQQLYGDSPLTPAEAFGGSDKARMAAHNDCLLASATDWGTYSENATVREAQKRYLSLDNRFVPQEGETCNANAEAQPYIQCANALAELKRMRWSALNIDYHPQVLNTWRRQGCFDTIAQKLGYRLRLLSLTYTPTVRAGTNLTLMLKLRNDGFASPYNPRGLELVLRNQANGQLYRFDLRDRFDPRRWLPRRKAYTLNITQALPPDLPTGTYDLLLNLPDPAPTLYGRPEYSIRFANKGTWEASTGFNKLAVLRVRGS